VNPVSSIDPDEPPPPITAAPAAHQLARRIRAASLGAALCLIGFAAAATWWDYRTILEQTRHQLQVLASMEQQQMSGLITATDQAIGREVERLRGRDLQKISNSEEEWQALRNIANALPFVINFIVIDEKGTVVLGRNAFPASQADVTFREYFTALRDGRDFYLGQTIFAERARDFTFTLSRAIRDADGRFKGAVMVGFDADYLAGLLGVGTNYPSSTFSILRSDGALIARYPLAEADVQRSYANMPVNAQVAKAPKGSYEAISPIDGELKLAAYDTVDDHQLYALAAVNKSDALAPWRNRATVVGALLAAVLLAGYVMYRSLQRSMAAEAGGQRALERANEQLSQLIRELDHRARNLLAVMHGMVRLGRGADIRTYRHELEGRLGALAHAQSLLAESHWTGADLETLARRELAAFDKSGGPRVTLSGMPLTWAARAAQPMAIVLHELTTNAVKYGALSIPGGSLLLSWEAYRNPGLILSWREHGMSGLTEPARKGFGIQVIEQTIASQLGGTTAFTWHDDGLECRIELPGDTLIANEVALGRRV
jgi:two-component sensor histidine kinase